MDNSAFGEWISVSRARPNWLQDGDRYQVVGDPTNYVARSSPDYYWGGTTSIRALSGHPIYSAKSSTPSNEEITQRMEKAIRRHVAGKADLHDDRRGPNITVEAEFRSIVEQLGTGTQASARDAAFALVTEMAERDAPLGVFGYDCFKRAREIADLPKPVDPIETRVTEIMRDHEIAPDDTGVRAAIRFALAAGGTAHE